MRLPCSLTLPVRCLVPALQMLPSFGSSYSSALNFHTPDLFAPRKLDFFGGELFHCSLHNLLRNLAVYFACSFSSFSCQGNQEETCCMNGIKYGVRIEVK